MTQTILEKVSETIAASYEVDIEAILNSADWEDLRQLCQRAEQEKANLNISDIKDQNHQYVDLVMEGGGVLGIALVGYILALESVGIRFLHIGGTSAGAITALLLAAANTPAEEKSQTLMQILSSMPMADFLDSKDKKIKQFLLKSAEHNFELHLDSIGDWLWHLPRLLLTGLPLFKILRKDYGLCQGEVFLNWIHKALEPSKLNCPDTSTLTQRMNHLPAPIKKAIREHHKPEVIHDHDFASFSLIATDLTLTTQSRLQFPEDAKKFQWNSEKNQLAEFVRCSMSIPLIFQPYQLAQAQSSQSSEKHYIVDGGMVSNFPIDIFHSSKKPARPTFGVKLQLDPDKVQIKGLKQFFVQNINAARSTLEQEFIRKNIDYQNLVCNIDTGNHLGMNFDMEPSEQIDLILRGVQAGLTFLFGSNDQESKGFNWEGYKTIREGLLNQRMESNVTDFPQSV